MPAMRNIRQVHLLASELLAELTSGGFTVAPGDLGENVTTTGLDLTKFPLGTRLRIGGSAVVELTGLRTPCSLIDRFQKG
jgi:MOSC domain-containing protein YiiM